MSTVDAHGKLACPHQRLMRKGGLPVHVNGWRAMESYVSTSTVDTQGRVTCQSQRLMRKTGLHVHVNG